MNIHYMTFPQLRKITLLWRRNPCGMRFAEFLDSAHLNVLCDYVSVVWCGMFVGIEPDGYSHT